MNKVIAKNVDELRQGVGIDLGPTRYFKVTQEKINLFAEATGDNQWIHVDVERAKKESPYKNTIAHGYFTVSLIPNLLIDLIQVTDCKLTVNYEVEKMRFKAPVIVDSEVRLKAKIVEVKLLREIVKMRIELEMEIKDNTKPALQGVIIILYSF